MSATATLLDGGMGQELINRSNITPTALWATEVMINHPDLVESIHRDYFIAGADIATMNSYGLLRDRLQPYGIEDQLASLINRAGDIVNRARDKYGSGLIAGSLGPNGASYRPSLVLEIEQGAELYAEIAQLQAPFVDVLLLETMVSIKQAKGAVLGASVPNKPIWLSVTVEDDNGELLRSGEPITDLVEVVQDYPVAALLINCSPPEVITYSMKTLIPAMQKADLGHIPIGAYANGFTKISDEFKHTGASVEMIDVREDLDPNAYLDFAKQWHQSGTSIIGGCCEVGPAHIARLAEHFK